MRKLSPLIVGTTLVGAIVALVITGGVLRSKASPAAEDRPTESARFSVDGNDVEVTFRGEVGHDSLFAPGEALTGEGGVVVPLDGDGEPEGSVAEARPTWLSFRYSINGDRRDVLIAKQPVMNHVSWEAIARAGAALGDGRRLRIGGVEVPQNATFEAADGHRYRVRLLRCGQSTTGPLSEWNLLIGAAHEGDQDFRGERYGWISEPYRDSDLKVGYKGSLTWCLDPWREDPRMRVARGYFKASRFHATPTDVASDRLYWRPVLERIDASDDDEPPRLAGISYADRPLVSPDRRVRYFGPIANAALFGDDGTVAELVGINDGVELGDGKPQWLKFQHEGQTLLVAAKAVRRSLSWETIAKVGAALGDGSTVQVGGSSYAQDAEIADAHGNRYRVRLLRCGEATLDESSEWNRLIGGVHRGDGDFVARADGMYGWIPRPISDRALGIVAGHGGATWCQETQHIHGERHAVNRGYLTVARFHLTPSDFEGSGFGWRPVLELIDGE